MHKRTCIADLPIKPPHLTSTGWIVAVQPAMLHSADSTGVVKLLKLCAAGIPSCQRIVSQSTIRLSGVDQITKSLLRVVCVVSDGKTSCFPRSSHISHLFPGLKRDVNFPTIPDFSATWNDPELLPSRMWIIPYTGFEKSEYAIVLKETRTCVYASNPRFWIFLNICVSMVSDKFT